MATSIDKRLAAVMCADIRGYTAMVQEDESAALRNVEVFQSQMSELTTSFNGRVVAFYGDGSTCVFDSVIDAVKCAIELQTAFISSGVPVRLGLHMGEITENSDGTFYGDGIQIASKIETKGEAGSVLVSESIFSELFNHREIETVSIGKYQVDSGPDRMEIYAITNNDLVIPSQQTKFPPLRKILRPALIIVLGIALAAIIGIDLVGRLVSDNSNENVRNKSIAVKFSDYAGLANRAELAEMTAHWIGSRIEDIPGSRVVNLAHFGNQDLVIANASASQRAKFANTTGATNVLEGQIFPDPYSDSLIFEARILGLATGTSKISFGPAKCSVEDPMACVNILTNEILGWWATRDANLALPPNYDAYREYLAAKREWVDNDSLAYAHLIEAIRVDSTFPDSYFLLASYYINQGNLEMRDSVLNVIDQKFKSLSPRLANTNAYFKAYAAGDLLKAHDIFLDELEYDPTDLFVNTEAMVNALEWVNAPGETIRLFNLIPVDSLDLNTCGYCRIRVNIAVFAYIRLNKPDSALNLLRKLPGNSFHLYEMNVASLVALGDTVRLNRKIQQAILQKVPGAGRLWAIASWHFKLREDDALSTGYAQRAVAVHGRNSSYPASIEGRYLLGEYQSLDSMYYPYMNRYPGHEYVMNLSARLFAHSDNTRALTRLAEIMDEQERNDPYHEGFYNYLRGVIAAIQGNKQDALDYLELARSQGRTFYGRYFDYDVDLMPLFDEPRFQSLIHPSGEK